MQRLDVLWMMISRVQGKAGRALVGSIVDRAVFLAGPQQVTSKQSAGRQGLVDS